MVAGADQTLYEVIPTGSLRFPVLAAWVKNLHFCFLKSGIAFNFYFGKQLNLQPPKDFKEEMKSIYRGDTPQSAISCPKWPDAFISVYAFLKGTTKELKNDFSKSKMKL